MLMPKPTSSSRWARGSLQPHVYKYNDISKTAKIVQVDIDPIALGRHCPGELGVAPDAGGR